MSRKGFTLIEMMVAMVITLIALGILGRAFLEQQVAYERESEVIEMQENAKIAMQMMTNELIMAGYLPFGTDMPSSEVSGETWSGSGAENIEEAAVNSITIMGDVDGDDVDDIDTIRYAWSGTQGDPLTRETWSWDGAAWGGSSGAQELALNIQSLDIRYYDGSNSELSRPLSSSDRDDVRKIQINLVSQLEAQTNNPDIAQPRTSKLTTELRPRNLGLVDQNAI